MLFITQNSFQNRFSRPAFESGTAYVRGKIALERKEPIIFEINQKQSAL